MPVKLDPRSGKWKIGQGKPMYGTKAAADKAYKGYLASKSGKPKQKGKRK